jgi:anti-sigma B factor antagonist
MLIESHELAGDAVALRLDGRLNMVAAPQLKAAIDDTVDAGKARVVVDLTHVTFMDSSGLGALIGGLKRARQASGDLRIARVSDQVSTVLKLTNLDRVLRPYDSVEAAADAW